MGKLLNSAALSSDKCPYELEAFMEKQGLSAAAARVILHSNGPSRHRCDHAAAAFLQFKQLKEAGRKPPAAIIKA